MTSLIAIEGAGAEIVNVQSSDVSASAAVYSSPSVVVTFTVYVPSETGALSSLVSPS